MWVVFNLTTYGDGIYFGGIYRSREKAEARLQYIEEHAEITDEDSWCMTYVPTGVPINYKEFEV